MKNLEFKILYENNNLLVIDKPAGIVVFPENKITEKTLIDLLLEKYPDLKNVGKPPRCGIVHRLDKDTSGILLVAKDNKILDFLQKQFKTGRLIKKYLALIVGNLKTEQGKIETFIGRSPKNRMKQKIYLPLEPGAEGKRKAITEYRTLKKFPDYTLVEVVPKTGRKHQIRCQFAHLGQPIAGDKLYGFKNQPCPKGLSRQFLHASYLEIKSPNNKIKIFCSDLSKDLKEVLKNLKTHPV